MSAAAADAQILLGGGGLEPLDRETVITDLSSPAGSGNLFVSISVDYPDGSDSTISAAIWSISSDVSQR